MTEKNNFEKGNSSLSNHKMKKGTSKNSWKHQMYELEIAIAKESSNKRRNELIKIHNGYIIWNSYNSENMSYTSSWLQEKVLSTYRAQYTNPSK